MSSNVIVRRRSASLCQLFFPRPVADLGRFPANMNYPGFDYETDIAETMQALHDVVQKGWALYIGMSSCHSYQFWQMQCRW